MQVKVKRQNAPPNGEFHPKAVVAIDTETTGIDVWGNSVPFMVSMCDEEGNTWCCVWDVDPFTRKVVPNPDDIFFIIDTIRWPGRSVVFHNSKFDVLMLAKVGIDVVALSNKRIHDTLFMARVCFTLELDYGLKWLSRSRLGIPDQDEKDLHTAVNSARRKLQMYNKKAVVYDKPLMLATSEPKEDFWLPRYFDPTNDLCERYARLDVYRTMGLSKFYTNIMAEDPLLLHTYQKEMQQVWPIVNAMEKRGMKIFPKAVAEESAICKVDMKKHMEAMLSIIKEKTLQPYPPEKITPPTKPKRLLTWKAPEFNPSSPQQLLRVLYLPSGKGGLGLETDRRAKKTGKPTTDKDTLRELMYEPFIRELAGYRAARHTLTLFFDKFDVLMKPDSIEKGAMVLHPGLNQCGTRTGRFSCANPNLQQVSSGGKKSLSASYNGAKVFGPRDGYIWLDFDYSQQEGRIFAYLAQVPVMLQALNTGTDLFEAMSNKTWGGENNPRAYKACIQALELNRTDKSDNEKVTAAWNKYGWKPNGAGCSTPGFAGKWLASFDYDIVAAEASLDKASCRQRCKHITYAKIFGGGPGSYTHLLYCSLEEAKIFDAEYNASMPEMRVFMKRIETEGKQNGFIVNLYGRKLRVESDFAYRGVSYMIQGSAADQMKEAIIKVDKLIKSTTLDAHLLVTIHDALRIEIKTNQLNKGFIRAVKARMEDTEGRIGVPMPVEPVLIRERWAVNEEKIKL